LTELQAMAEQQTAMLAFDQVADGSRHCWTRLSFKDRARL